MAAARTITQQQWAAARKHGHTARLRGVPHILTQDTATGAAVLVPVQVAKPPRKRTPVLLHRDPAGIDGGTAILSDGSRVHFGPQIGAKLVIERRGESGYEITLATCEDIPEVAERTRVIESAAARRMTPAEHAAWNRAAGAVGYPNVQPDNLVWTCALSDGGGTATRRRPRSVRPTSTPGGWPQTPGWTIPTMRKASSFYRTAADTACDTTAPPSAPSAETQLPDLLFRGPAQSGRSPACECFPFACRTAPGSPEDHLTQVSYSSIAEGSRGVGYAWICLRICLSASQGRPE